MVPWLAAIVGLCILYLPTLASGFALMQNDPGDTRLENYILEHSYLWLLQEPGHSEFWSPPIFYPVKNAAAFTDILLGTAPVYWLLRAVAFAPDTAFQLWMIGMALANFGAFYLWVRRGLGFAVTPAAAGSFLFAFAAPRGAQASHPQLLPHFLSILALIALTEIFKRPTAMKARLWIGVFVGASVLELYTAFYLGWLLFFGLLLGGCIAIANRSWRARIQEALRAQWAAWAVALVASAAALYPLASHYLAAAESAGYRPYESVMPPRIQSWLYQGGGLYSWQNGIKAFHMLSYEHRQGIGWLSWALAGIGLWRFRARAWAWIALGTAVLAIALTSEFYPGLTAWRGLFYAIPGAKAIRALSRVSLLVLIPASLGLAAYFQSSRRKPWQLAALATVVALEQIQPTPSYDKLRMRNQVKHLVEAVPRNCPSFYYVSTSGLLDDYVYQLDAVWAALDLGVPTINGYSGTAPPLWRPLMRNIATSESELAAIKAKAEAWHGSQSDSRFCLISVSDFKDR